MTSFELNRVVVVDPNPFMGKLLQSILFAFDIPEVILCQNAEEAWTLVSKEGCDCLVTDWLPPADGAITMAPTLDLVKRLRADPAERLRKLPVLLCTARTQLKEVVAARDSGVTEILSKPVSVQQILAKLKSALQMPRPFVETQDFRGPDRRRHSSQWQGPERRHRLALPQQAIDNVMEGLAA